MEKLYIVIPCYNEEEVLPETARRLKIKMNTLMTEGKISQDSRVLFSDDGSRDRTWELIRGLSASDPLFEGIRLAHNRGHQNALLAGLLTAAEKCDLTISMDADLQDDINAVDRMLEEREKGAEIVYGVRGSRKTDTFFKRFTAEGYYKVLAAMGVEAVFNCADYRLMGPKAMEALAEHREVNLFLRGIVPSLGFKTAEVTYDRAERFAGTSKYPLKKMLNLAWQGVTSFSVKPLGFITLLGFLFALLACLGLIAELIVALCSVPVPGWLVLLGVLVLVSGIQLIALGIVGSYIGKIYQEVKARPRYIISEKTF